MLANESDCSVGALTYLDSIQPQSPESLQPILPVGPRHSEVMYTANVLPSIKVVVIYMCKRSSLANLVARVAALAYAHA